MVGDSPENSYDGYYTPIVSDSPEDHSWWVSVLMIALVGDNPDDPHHFRQS